MDSAELGIGCGQVLVEMVNAEGIEGENDGVEEGEEPCSWVGKGWDLWWLVNLESRPTSRVEGRPFPSQPHPTRSCVGGFPTDKQDYLVLRTRFPS